MNEFYNHSSFPTQGSVASSASMRAELDAVAAGFDKLPPLTGNGGKTLKVNASGTGIEALQVDPGTLSGNLSLTGTGARITGDFSNATIANRVMFQTSTVNSSTQVGALPTGTNFVSTFTAYGNQDSSQAPFMVMGMNGTDSGYLSVGRTGAAGFLPMTFYTGGSERMRIDTSGNVGIGGANTSGNRLDIKAGSWANNQNIGLTIATPAGANGWLSGIKLKSDGAGVPRLAFDFPTGSTFGNAEGLIIDTNGNVLANSGSGGLGYGSGSGGQVTQVTSRTTAVTLHKPSGKITMFTAAGSATWSQFTVNNSLVATTDTITLSVEGGNSNIYLLTIVGISAGSFIIGFATTGGTASDTPRINFNVFKGAAS